MRLPDYSTCLGGTGGVVDAWSLQLQLWRSLEQKLGSTLLHGEGGCSSIGTQQPHAEPSARCCMMWPAAHRHADSVLRLGIR